MHYLVISYYSDGSDVSCGQGPTLTFCETEPLAWIATMRERDLGKVARIIQSAAPMIELAPPDMTSK